MIRRKTLVAAASPASVATTSMARATTSNFVSPLKNLCLDCHGPMSPNGPYAATLIEHTHHKSDSAGGQCIACHMPKIQTTTADAKVRAHTFAFIYPAATDRHKIANPCTFCHSNQSTSWATEAMRHWPEFSPWRMER